MAEWMVESEIATAEKIEEIRKEAKKYARDCKRRAWENYSNPVKTSLKELQDIYSVILSNPGEIRSFCCFSIV